MTITSHRIKVEEKRALKKLLTTLAIFVFTLLFFIYIGLPLLAKIIVTLSSLQREKISNKITAEPIIQRPILDSLVAATNSATVTFSGYGEKEATVKILINNEEVARTLTDSDARFITQDIKLVEGLNVITAISLKDSQESSPSSLSITYIQKPPKLDILTPSEGQKFSGELKDIRITGETDPGNKVTINERLVIVNQEGKFNFPFTLSSGDNFLKIVATDKAGNQTIVERKVSFTP